jgi:HD-GYP domain-containing protein (c-di-GMP phosphodiesterase class II)
MGRLSKAIAQESGEFEKGEIDDIEVAGALCNLGMALMPDTIINKEEKLSDDEKRLFATHPLMAIKVLEKVKGVSHLIPFIRHHHERWNGTGYPDRLKENDIPVEASILGIADFYTELTMGSKRQKAAGKQEAINAINTLKDNFFSKKIIDLFNKAAARI